MAYTTVNKSTDYFNTKLYEGNGSSPRSITGIGFQPDWTWTKNRDNTNGHGLFDAVRGYTTGKGLSTHNNNGEGSADGYGYLSSRDSDGYTMTAGGSSMTMNNTNGESYVSWNWKAGGTGSANTVGTINSTVSVNTTAGFSIVKYTGNGVSGATVGHGLGVAPKIVLIKKTSSSDSWSMLNTNIDLNYYLKLEGTDAQVNDALFNNTAPSTTLFTVDSDGQVNGNGNEFIAYCFAEVTGYSKFGSWVSNNNANGTFVYTGFAPSFVMLKEYDGTNQWVMYDNKRPSYNQTSNALFANANSAEATDLGVDLLSNGYKIRATNNQNTGNYIYMAFGQSLVGSNNVPCTAR